MVELKTKAIEMLYKDRCEIIEYQKIRNENKSMGFAEVSVIKDQPCRLSVESSGTAADLNGAATAAQTIKIFISPNITVAPGSKIIVTHFGKDTAYKSSGFPSVYCSHQEVNLELFRGWA